MSLITSSHFASAGASGADWRDVSKKILEDLESVRTEDHAFNLGFLYISDALADDAVSILNLFRSVTGIENWVGCLGVGVCTAGAEYIDEPAISAMIGCFDAGQFQIFPACGLDTSPAKKILQDWTKDHNPMLVLAHGDPMGDDEPSHVLEALDQLIGGFMVGGLSSSRKENAQFAGEMMEGGVSGIVFDSSVKVATALTQGCSPIGGPHRITRCEDHVILELDDGDPLDVFTQNLKDMVKEKIGQDPDDIVLEEGFSGALEDVPPEYQDLFKKEIHVAFPVPGSDQKDYMVRNLIGVDADNGQIAVAQPLHDGDQILFVYRDDETVRADLSRMLVDLRKRVMKDYGEFKPKAALYVSCVARAFSSFGGQKTGEMALIQEVIGDVPLAGFYASGEISGHRLYGHTGVLTLFL